jgi:hypothetical protein
MSGYESSKGASMVAYSQDDHANEESRLIKNDNQQLLPYK